MFLKKEPFGPDGQVVLYELSALQRIEYLEYMDSQETAEPFGEEGSMKQLAAFARRQANVNAWLVSRSLGNDNPLRDEAEFTALQEQVLRSWALEALSDGAAKVIALSGMMPSPDAVEDNVAESEPVTTEKSSGQNETL